MRKSVLLMLVCWVCGWMNAQTTYVVSVGIADYRQIHDLKYTENDVDSFNKVMRQHTRNISILKGKQATHKAVLNRLQTVFKQATNQDAVILFFSGHGYPKGFCCYDMDDKSNKGGLSYQELQQVFRQCKAGKKMVFADACFSGGMRMESKHSSSVDLQKSDVMFFLSSRTNESSQESMGGQNGVFTRFLVRGLGGGADKNRDKVITAKELFDFVHQMVSGATYQKQHPVMWGKFDHSMTVLDWNR